MFRWNINRLLKLKKNIVKTGLNLEKHVVNQVKIKAHTKFL